MKVEFITMVLVFGGSQEWYFIVPSGVQCTKRERSELAQLYQILGFSHCDKRMGFGTLILQTNG